MPIVFYYGQDKLKAYKNYTGGHDWNSDAALTDIPGDGPNEYARTEEGILDCLNSNASRFATISRDIADGASFYALIRSIAAGGVDDRTVYILKGIHTKPELHFSVGFETYIYHLNVRRLGSDYRRFSIHSFSKGGRAMDDPEWEVVRAK